MTDKTILPAFYFGPISYFSEFIDNPNTIYIDGFENFIKQTYRNRCIIQNANGRLPIIIPIQHNGERKLKDIQISYESNWMNIHWKSIKSSYQGSPYFEYYQEDLLREIFTDKETSLFSFNLKTIHWAIKKLKLDTSLSYTDSFIENPKQDLRNMFTTKHKNELNNTPYIQVFSDRFDFMNDLSILDLLFNVGPRAIDYITKGKDL